MCSNNRNSPHLLLWQRACDQLDVFDEGHPNGIFHDAI